MRPSQAAARPHFRRSFVGRDGSAYLFAGQGHSVFLQGMSRKREPFGRKRESDGEKRAKPSHRVQRSPERPFPFALSPEGFPLAGHSLRKIGQLNGPASPARE